MTNHETNSNYATALGMAAMPLALCAGGVALFYKMIDVPASEIQTELIAEYRQCADYSQDVYGNKPDGKIQIKDVSDAAIKDCQLETFISENVQPSASGNTPKLLSPDTIITFPSQAYINTQIDKADDFADAMHTVYQASIVVFGAMGLYGAQNLFRKYKNWSPPTKSRLLIDKQG